MVPLLKLHVNKVKLYQQSSQNRFKRTMVPFSHSLILQGSLLLLKSNGHISAFLYPQPRYVMIVSGAIFCYGGTSWRRELKFTTGGESCRAASCDSISGWRAYQNNGAKSRLAR